MSHFPGPYKPIKPATHQWHDREVDHTPPATMHDKLMMLAHEAARREDTQQRKIEMLQDALQNLLNAARPYKFSPLEDAVEDARNVLEGTK